MIDILESRKTELAGLCVKYGVRRLDVFGSAARGDFTAGKSDIDLIADFRDRGPGYADRYFSFAEELEALLNVRIDLLTERHFSNPYFRQSVAESLQTVYAA